MATEETSFSPALLGAAVAEPEALAAEPEAAAEPVALADKAPVGMADDATLAGSEEAALDPEAAAEERGAEAPALTDPDATTFFC